MKATQQLQNAGQSLWLDNISRGMLDDGTLHRYIADLSVTGLTSNPTIFEHALAKGNFYDDAIREKSNEGMSGESLFFDLALEDLRRAAELFHPTHERTSGVDGWVSLEVSPLLANDAAGTIAAAAELHRRAARPNLFIKIPGTPAGIVAIEESIANGVPVNVTLLFSAAQYVAAANAHLRGIERRVAAGLDPHVGSVASLFVSRWDVAVADKVPSALHNKLGIAVAQSTYREYRRLLSSPRWIALAAVGVQAQRLLFASTGTKDPKASDTLYVEALAAPDTVNTIPEKTLIAFADHGRVSGALLPDGGNAELTLTSFRQAGIDVDALGEQLQREGAASFDKSWNALLVQLARKQEALVSHLSALAGKDR
ncbi:MAG: transaldolase [Gemmatimonadaceae bacterium]